MNDRVHSATGVLPHPFNTTVRLEKLWVAIGSLASASANHFAAVTQVLRSSLSQNVAINRRVYLEDRDMYGRKHSPLEVLPLSFNTQMRLEKLWVAMCSLASASANHFLAVAQVLRLSLS